MKHIEQVVARALMGTYGATRDFTKQPLQYSEKLVVLQFVEGELQNVLTSERLRQFYEKCRDIIQKDLQGKH